MTAIRRPGVEVTQEFVSESASILEPTLAPVVIGPCFRVIDAFDDSGNAQSEAYAGTYQDGNGTISYDLPSLGDTDDLTSLTDEMRVFLVVGSTTTELNDETDESLIVDDGVGDFDATGDTLTDETVDFESLGVEIGDVVRLSWRGKTYDVPITAVDPTELTLEDSDIVEDLAGTTYDIVRNPAQWAFSSGTQASVTLGDEEDYLTITALPNGALGGSVGDGVVLTVVESAEVSADPFFAWDSEARVLTLTLGRAASATNTTLSDIEAMITDDGDDNYDAAIAALFTAEVTGDGSDLATAGSYTFDGGSDNYQLLLDADLIGSTTPTGKVYVSYRSLRLDVSAAAESPALLSVTSTTDLESQVSPVTTRNPLALGLYFALLNSGSNTVKGLGLSEVSATKPDGTADAYAEAIEFLQGQDVYFLVPLTQDPTALSLFQAHVDSMSEPAQKSERVCLVNREFPSYATATTVALGVQGNTGASFNSAGTRQFSTSTDMAAAGVLASDVLVVSSLADNSTLTAVHGTSGPLYGLAVSAIHSGDDYTLDVTVPAGLPSSWNNLMDVDFTVYRAGAAITSVSATAAAIEDFAPAFEDRRVFMLWPDQVVADVNGTSTTLDGTYLACAWAGKMAGSNPGSGFTNSTVAGFTGLKHSNGYYSEDVLNDFAGSGLWVNIQESSGAAIKCRHQLSTDVSSIQKREASITTVIDYVAKFFRLALSKKIGKFNITQQFLDSLATQIQGLGRYLVEAKILKSFKLTSLQQNADQPDTIDITCTISPFYPANYISLTLQV